MMVKQIVCYYTGLHTKDKTVKTTQNSKKYDDLSLILVSAFISVFWWLTKWLSQFWPEPWIQENGLYKIPTVVSEVSSFVGNPVSF